jgi:hypothetical protein
MVDEGIIIEAALEKFQKFIEKEVITRILHYCRKSSIKILHL